MNGEAKTMTTVADEITALFVHKGRSAYFGEAVSQLEHALQTAHFAQQAGASPALVVAALVHDIGHLVADTPEDIADLGIDAKHEEIGQKWLTARFSTEVVEPVYLHVSAKRYLCATSSSYLGKLSPASVQSLALQGGPMTSDEVREFKAHRYHREALALRAWDDQAKIPNLVTPSLGEYKALINMVAAQI
jgi:phosphonate degradation associated HDIG domain protein